MSLIHWCRYCDYARALRDKCSPDERNHCPMCTEGTTLYIGDFVGVSYVRFAEMPAKQRCSYCDVLYQEEFSKRLLEVIGRLG